MEIYIPRVYKLHINELKIDGYWINGMININNMNLYINRDGYVYKISSNIKLIYLLDVLDIYDDELIKKIYYYLIIKYLSILNKRIKHSSKIYRWIYGDCFYDKLVKTREIYICSNDKVIITSNINYNICLIINNKTIYKSLIAIIDKNTDISNLDDLLKNIYVNNKYEEIDIWIFGGGLDNIDKIIKIYLLLKKMRLSKFITGTYIINKNPLKRIKYNINKNKIKWIDTYIYREKEININDCISSLHRLL